MVGFFSQRPSFSFVLERARAALLRFPMVLLSSVLFCIGSIWMIEAEGNHELQWLMIIALGIPLFTSLALFRERRGASQFTARLLEIGTGLAFLIAYYFGTRSDDTINFFIQYLQISLIVHLSVSFIAFIGRPGTAEFWQFNRRVFLRFALSTLYAGVFFVGLAIALATTNALFHLEVKSKIYEHLFVVSVCLVQCWHFLAGVPELSDLRSDASYPSGLRTFVQFLLIPLVSLYMTILYVYMGKILATQDWPSGSIAWLVSAMAVLGLFNLLLIDPEKKTNRWIETYSKFFYVLVLPLLALLFVAIGKRVSAYGVTEQRYFLIVLGAWLVGGAFYFLFSRAKSIKVIPISLATLSLVTLVGPWSAPSVSWRSQAARAETLMTQLGALENGRVQRATVSATEAQQKDLSSILDYLVRSQGASSLARWFAPSTLANGENLPSSKRTSAELMKEMGLEYIPAWGTRYPTRLYFSADQHQARNLSGFNQIAPFEIADYHESRTNIRVFGKNKITLFLLPSQALITLRINDGKEVEVPLTEFIQRLRSGHGDSGKEPRNEILNLEPESMRFDVQVDGVLVRLEFRELNGDLDDGKITVHSVTGWVLMK